MTRENRILAIVCGCMVGVLALGHVYGGDFGLKYSQHFSINDYLLQPQNWWIVQDDRGMIYVANQGGVLKYDGVSWDTIEIPNISAHSLAIDRNNTIYIGGINELGYLERFPNGKLQYHTLLPYLENNKKSFDTVLETYAIGDFVIFRTERYVFRWNIRSKQMITISPLKGKEDYPFMSYSQICGGQFFVNQKNVGLLRINGNSFEKIPGGERFASITTIFMVVPFQKDRKKLLIGTREEGFFLYDGKTATPYSTVISADLNKTKANHGIILKHTPGDIVVATLLGGIAVLDKQGNTKSFFMKNFGLTDNDVKFVYEDSQGDLWAALGKGIAKIDYASPISIYDDRTGLQGLVMSVIRFNGLLYIGTTQGLFYLEPKTNRVAVIPAITSICYSLLSMDGSLLIATPKGVFTLRDNTIRSITSMASFVMVPSQQDHHRVWVGTSKTLVALYHQPGQKNNEWKIETGFTDVKGNIRTLVEDDQGTLWLGLRTAGALMVRFPVTGSIQPHVVTTLNEKHELPKEELQIFYAAGHVMFGAAEGLFRFDKGINKFIKDDILGKEFSSSLNYVYRLQEDEKKAIWFHAMGKNYEAIPKQDGTYTILSKPFARIPLSSQVNGIYFDPVEHVTWFATTEGLLRFDSSLTKDFSRDYYTVIRKLSIDNTPQFYDIFESVTPAVFSPSQRNFRIEFAAPFFEDQSGLQFRYLLEGYNDSWSQWNTEKYKDFTNLDSGNYRLRLQSKNVYGTLGQEATFAFKILSPWYRTPIAYAIYILLLFPTVFLFVRWRFKWKLKKLEQEKQKLELVVKERTKEISRKNAQLSDQALQLKELDQAKSRFFASISHEFRTPLTLILGPLEQMLARELPSELKDKTHLMFRNANRLLSLINRLLDLSRIESGKMKLKPLSQDIIAIVKGIISTFEHKAIENQLEIRFIYHTPCQFLCFDAEKMEDILGNLIANALKFTPPKGLITISIETIFQPEEDFPQGVLRLSVVDTGSGIPQQELSHIFDLFYQVDESNPTHKGSGIGLALVKELVNLHHGKIDVNSRQGENSGTEFLLRFPLGEDLLNPSEDMPHSEPDETKQTPMEDEKPFSPAPSELTETPPPTTRSTILVVEDNPDMRQFIRESIQEYYSVIEAENGCDGIEQAQSLMPDLIISDIMMPEVDGYQLCQTLKNDFRTSHIPVIFLTAMASDASKIRGLKTQADDYIVKPFNKEELLSRIANLIQLRRQLQEKFQRQMRLEPDGINESSIDEKFLKKLHDVVEANLSDPELNVEGLSEKMKISRVTLNKKILALTGEKANEFIRSYRLKRAVQLLEQRAGNITQISLDVGFSNSAYFTKCFREKFHRLPSDYFDPNP